MSRDETYLRQAIEQAKQAKAKGNLPYGCVLVDAAGQIILQAGNTIVSDNDCLAHAEINLIRTASQSCDNKILAQCTIYTSDEPCPMCTSAIYWSGIGRLVYGLSKKEYYRVMGRDNSHNVFDMPVRELLAKGGRQVEVVGPLLETEVAQIHRSK